MRNRVLYFDQMKAVAIILVVIGHLTQFCFGMSHTDVNRWLEIFQMPVFFFISGYFVYKVKYTFSEIRKALWKKVHSIGLPLLVWCFIWTSTHEGETFFDILLRGGGKYWFLFTLVVLSIFFILYEQVASKIKSPWFYIAAWCLPFILLVVAKITFGGVDSIVNYYRYYLVGFLCRKYAKFNNLLFLNPISYTVAFLALSLQFIYADRCNYFLIFLGAMGGIVLLQGFFASFDQTANKRIKLLRVLSFIGTKTLPIYLIHYFFIPQMKQYGNRLTMIDNPFIVHIFVCLLLALIIIIASLIIERVIDRNRYLSWVMFGKSLQK